MIFQYDGGRVDLQRMPDGTYRALVGEQEYRFAATAFDGGWLITLDGRQHRVYTAARGDERYAALDGETYTLITLDDRRKARVASAGSGDLTAQMPGQVREVFVSAGEAVERGQALLLLEAMKMEIRVTAPAAGRVKRLLVKAGDVVDRGQRLVELE